VFDHPATNGQAANGVFAPPLALHFSGHASDADSTGNLWVPDTGHNRLSKYDPTARSSACCRRGDFPADRLPRRTVVDNPDESPSGLPAAGGIGIDSRRQRVRGGPAGQDVARFPAPIPLPRADGVAHSTDAICFQIQLEQFHRPMGLANPGYVLFINDHQMVVRPAAACCLERLPARHQTAGERLSCAAEFYTQFDPTISHDRISGHSRTDTRTTG